MPNNENRTTENTVDVSFLPKQVHESNIPGALNLDSLSPEDLEALIIRVVASMPKYHLRNFLSITGALGLVAFAVVLIAVPLLATVMMIPIIGSLIFLYKGHDVSRSISSKVNNFLGDLWYSVKYAIDPNKDYNKTKSLILKLNNQLKILTTVPEEEGVEVQVQENNTGTSSTTDSQTSQGFFKHTSENEIEVENTATNLSSSSCHA